MGTCTIHTKSKEKQTPIADIKRNTEMTLHSNKLTEAIKSETIIYINKTNHECMQSKDICYRSPEDFDAPTAIVTLKEKTPEETTKIKKALMNHFLFSCFPKDNLQELIKEMKYYSLGAKEIIFRQGEYGSNFFTLASGTVEIVINGVIKGYIHEGHGFGELALITDSERTATIRTITQVNLWGIDRKVFRDALKSLSQMKYEENKNFIKGLPFVNSFTESQIELLVSVVVNHSFKDGQIIIVEGDPGELFYLIQQGTVQCSYKNQIIRVLHQGDYFGEQALIYNVLRTATITAVGKVELLCLSRDSLITVLGDQFQDILYKNSLRISFDRCEILKKFNKIQIETIIEHIIIKRYNENDIIITKGTKKNEFIWFVLKGCLNSIEIKTGIFDNIGAKWIYDENST